MVFKKISGKYNWQLTDYYLYLSAPSVWFYTDDDRILLIFK